MHKIIVIVTRRALQKCNIKRRLQLITMLTKWRKLYLWKIREGACDVIRKTWCCISIDNDEYAYYNIKIGHLLAIRMKDCKYASDILQQTCALLLKYFFPLLLFCRVQCNLFSFFFIFILLYLFPNKCNNFIVSVSMLALTSCVPVALGCTC